MEPTEGLIPSARRGEPCVGDNFHSPCNINRDNESRWAPTRFVR